MHARVYIAALMAVLPAVMAEPANKANKAIVSSIPVPVPAVASSVVGAAVAPSASASASAIPVVGATTIGAGALPVGGAAAAAASLIPGLATDPTTMLNNLSEAVQLLQFIANLLQTVNAAGAVSIPGVTGYGLIVEGNMINSLLVLVASLVASISVPTH